MPKLVPTHRNFPVALRTESVDRNWFDTVVAARPAIVALRKESVDRNISEDVSYSIIVNVALRKESVDRNSMLTSLCCGCFVALRKESVDRNITGRKLPAAEPPSLSARRAWIEIPIR